MGVHYGPRPEGNTPYVPPPGEVSFITSATTTTSSIVIPAAAQAGDVAYLMNTGGDNGSATIPPMTNEPLGWTKIATVDSSSTSQADAARSKYYVRVLASGDLNTTVTGASGVTSSRMTMLIFRPDYPVTTITTSTVNSFGLINASPMNQTQTINVTPLTAPTVIISSAYTFAGVTTGLTMTPTEDGTVIGGTSTQNKYLIQNLAKANVSTTYSVNNGLATLVSFGMSFS
jgi:hypothetical protein